MDQCQRNLQQIALFLVFSLTRITISRSGDAEEGSGRVISKLWMVDLGGSERLLKTGATGQTLDEGKAINLSLSALADVIASLKKKRNHIPYRNSKLTQILSDSLGDDSKVLMIVHISPSEDDTGETICSLSFAKRVRAIEPNREISEDLKKQKERRVAELNHQIDEAAVELQKVRNRIERTEELIQEKKLRLPPLHRLLEDDRKGSPGSPPVVVGRGGAVPEAPRAGGRTAGGARAAGSVPRFMASTASSRRRLSASGDASGRPGAPSSRAASGRTPAELSQSLGWSEPSFEPSARTRGRHCATTSRDTKASSASSSSRPIFGVAMHQHRRRMSDLT